MPYFDDGKDDMDAYLRRFERVVQVQEHDEREWAAHLAVLLKGKALEVFVRLSAADAEDYQKVKAALLRRYDLTEEGFKRKFRTSRVDSGETHSQFLERLRNYVTRWIQLSNTAETFEGLVDLLLKEQILNC
jgi:broad specificity phosphatase PhoE